MEYTAVIGGKEKQQQQSRGLTLALVLFVLLDIALVAVIAAPFAYDALYAQRIFPGVQVLGIALGGMTRDEARAALSQPIADREGQILTMTYGDRRWTASAAELGLRYDLEATIDAAYAVGRGQGIVGDSRLRLDLWRHGQLVEPVVQTDRVHTLDYLHRLARDIDVTMQNASLTITNQQVVATPARTGYRLDIDTSAARILAALQAGTTTPVALVVATILPQVTDQSIADAQAMAQRLLAGPVTVTFSGRDWVLNNGTATSRNVERTWTIDVAQLAGAVSLDQRKAGEQVVLSSRFDGDKFAALFASIAKEINRKPQDARFDFDTKTGRLIPTQISQEGRTVDVAENVRRLVAAAGSDKRTMQLAVTITRPAVALEDMNKMGIRELISQGVTTFAGSRPARAHNIQLAAAKLNGLVIPPGGTFSLLDAISPITAEAGYQEGYAIIGESTVQDIGGGVCQVATTTFRAFYRGGFQLIERNQHRYRLRVYEIKGGPVGLDAAIYDPGKDLKFKNNTNGYLLIQTDTSDPSNFTVSIYGTKPGWTVTISDPVTKPGKPHGPRLPDIEDPNQPVGTRIPVQPAEDGLIVSITRIVKQGNTIISQDTLNTTYQPANEQWIVGTKK